MVSKDIEILRLLTTREFTDTARETLANLLSKEMDRTITQIECIFILHLFDIGRNTVFPKEPKK